MKPKGEEGSNSTWGRKAEHEEELSGKVGQWSWLWLMVLLVVVLLVYLSTGAVRSSPLDIMRMVWQLVVDGEAVDQRLLTVVWEIRLPRGIMAIMVGAALATAGASLQGLFRNPLADPGLIGVSSGGAVGAIVGISSMGLLPVSMAVAGIYIPLLAMLGAIGTTLLVYGIARIAGRTHVTTLLLAGVAINALAGAIVGAVLYMSDNDALRRFTFWTLGSLHTADWQKVWILLVCTGIPLLILPRYRFALNAFLLGEAEAYHLGFQTQKLKRTVITLSAMMVGATVAFCGLIGFVGLVVPHLVRMVTGPDFRRLLPASALTGACLLLGADLLARTLNAPSEIPLGVITSLLGAPFFLYLIYQRKRDLGV